jgi:tRNA(fMet)-specific endonuclease VapC
VTGYLIDTDICSAHLRGDQSVTRKFMSHLGELHISVVTLGELLSWTLRANCPHRYHASLQQFLGDVNVVDVDEQVAQRFGEIRAHLFDHGTPVASIDVLIGATALIHDLTMVTHNVQHFSKIPGLTVEDWLTP